MSDVRINQIRLVKLMKGDIEPQTRSEEVFLQFYLSAISGVLLASELETDLELVFNLTIEEVLHILIGYAKGQEDLEANDQELFADSNDKKTIH